MEWRLEMKNEHEFNLQILIQPTPNVMHIVQTSDLREEPGKRCVIAASEVNRTRPVIAPLDHGARLQAIRTHFVDIVAGAIGDQRPVAERQQVLEMARAQIGAALLHQRQIVLE